MSTIIRTALLFLGALFALGAWAQPVQDEPPNGAPDQGDQADQPDPPSRVARLSFIRGAVSFVPAGENDWVEAQINRPLITGDKLWTDHGSRAELEIGASAIRIDEETSFDFLNLDDQTAQIELTQGAMNLRVRRLYDNQVYEIDTPTLAFVINRVGEYRVTIAPNGDSTSVAVLRGAGDAYGEGGARFRVEEGQFVTFNDSQLRDYYTDALPPEDDFDAFIAQRDSRWDHARSRQYVSEDVIGYEDLDDNGEWSDVPEYGHVWYPTTVAVGWTPYHYGHWGWVGAYGWTWIDDAPWGFAPFHYGRWAYVSGRWGWCPGPIAVRPYYAPALVAFIGGGGGVSISVGGPVGWFALGPRDVYFPGYHTSRRYFTNVNVSNTIVNTTVINNYYGGYARGTLNYGEINYHNRGVAGAVIAVPATAFASARPVHQVAVAVNRDTFANARVSSFAAVAPTRASLAATSGRAAKAPPAAVLDRRIVAASKPPPPVASFAAREQILQRNPGQPLNTRQLHALPAAQTGARPAVNERANVKVVTNAGVPAKTPAAPLVLRGNANAVNAGGRQNGPNALENRRGPVNVQQQQMQQGQQTNGRAISNGAINSGRPAGEGAGAAAAGPNQHVQSSRFVHGNDNKGAVDNGPKTRAVDANAGRPPVTNQTQTTTNAGRQFNPANANVEGNSGRGNANGNGANGRGDTRTLRSNSAAGNPNVVTGQGNAVQGQGQGNAQQTYRANGPDNRQPKYHAQEHVDSAQQSNAQQYQRVQQAPVQRVQQAPVQRVEQPQQVQRTLPPPPPPQQQYQRAPQPQPQNQRGQPQNQGKDKNDKRDKKDDDNKHGGH